MTNTGIHVTGIFTYPIKSCGGLSHDSLHLIARGFAHDRQWMIVSDEDGEQGEFITQREFPRMSLIQPAINGDSLIITAPNAGSICVPLVQAKPADRDVVIWGDTCRAVDEGDLAAEWVSQFLGAKLRLVRIDDHFQRPVSMQYTDQPSQTGFSDGYPILLIGEESLADLNAHLQARGKSTVPMNRFRPNIVIKGAAAFAEDTWKWINVGGIRMEVAKPCGRCVMTTVNQSTGIADLKEPLATIASYRTRSGKAMFGQNVIHRALGTISVGAEVSVLIN